MVVVFAGDSIMKKQNNRSFITIENVPTNSSIRSSNQTMHKIEHEEGTLFITRGKSESHKPICPKTRTFSRFLATYLQSRDKIVKNQKEEVDEETFQNYMGDIFFLICIKFKYR